MHKSVIISIVYPPTTPAFSHPSFPEGGEAIRRKPFGKKGKKGKKKEIEIVNRLLSEYAVYIDDSEVAHGTLDEIIDFLNNIE